jgi:hypothetical protein
LNTTRRPRGKGAKPSMLHTNVRLPEYVVSYFKEFPSYTKEIRRVLEEHVTQVDNEGATRVALDQQRWQDILAEENDE